jgi:hypothetical protein
VKTEHALRYLLLRHLRRYRDAVPAARYLEVTRSLTVAREQDDWLLAWRDGDVEQGARIAAADFAFYRRGDTNPERRTVVDSIDTPNNARAARFAAEAFGAQPPPPAVPEPLEGRPALAWLEDGAFVLALLIGGQARLAVVALLLAAAERRGRLWCTAALLPAALLAPAAPLAGLAAVYAGLQWLDPNRSARTARIALAAAAALIAVLRLAIGSGADGGLLTTAAVTVAATAVFVAQTVQRIHFRALPLAWPWLCAGLAVAGASGAAWLGLAALAGGIAGGTAARHLAPLQRERSLTPNG